MILIVIISNFNFKIKKSFDAECLKVFFVAHLGSEENVNLVL